jgi:NADPH:quinone reductase-like Zn-dependent oxidoreductase
MRQWMVRPHHSERLAKVEADERDLRFGEVRIRMHAASLNFRDHLLLGGRYPTGRDEPVVPLSDGAGEVIALGEGVSRVVRRSNW